MNFVKSQYNLYRSSSGNHADPKIFCLPSLKCLPFHEFFIFFQKSGSYVELRSRTVHFRRENGARGPGTWRELVGTFFLLEDYNLRTISRIAPTCRRLKNPCHIFCGAFCHFDELLTLWRAAIALWPRYDRCARYGRCARWKYAAQ